MENVVVARGIHTAFGGQIVHDDVNLTVARGEVMGLVGGSGSGKSVLLKHIVGLTRPQAGHIEVLGVDIADRVAAHRQQLRRRWGVLFQEGALFSSMTIAENIKTPMRELSTLPGSVMDDLARIKIGMVGLSPDTLLKMPAQLSGGMRKRAALARALALDPELLFLDEPTAGLDPIGAAQFDRLIKELQETHNLTVVMATHDLDSLYEICDRVMVLSDGRDTTGTIAELAENATPWITAFFHGPRGQRAAAGHGQAG